MIFCGFNLIASKVLSIIIMLALLVTLFWAKNWLTRICTLLFAVGIGFLWWPGDGVGLQYVVLFLGVMSGMYSTWGIVEDLVVRKGNESDASKFSQEFCCPAQFWGIIWFLISLVFMGLAIFLALVIF
eukprot:NODE_2065_length_662_cov_1.461682_g2015_i0.p1 GENE.NODE_2065_length_662_cov_1.461682_g2015_i0~~NODE_2065_length_662_cov_1.461682_g2015_i0.p1  ORF type:complete len:128 (+),score=19.09 NODE_2065_length_662_cov_1.461682_g2015_i0:207-590(+)